MRSLRTLAAAAFFLFLAMAVPAAASGVRVSTHNRTCTVPSPDPNDANWWLTSIVSVGDYFLLSADYDVSLSNKSRLYLLDPSSCTVVSSAVVPQKGGCDSVLQNTQSEWVVALFCPIDSSGCAPTNSLYSITVGGNGALVLNGTTFRSNRKPTGCFLNSPVAGADGLMYFFSGPSNFENDFTLVSYDAVSNKVTLLANYTALNGIDDTLVAMSPYSDRFVVARGTPMSSSAEWAVFDSSTGEEVGTVSDGRDLQQAYVMSGGVTVVVGSADSANTEVATLSWTTYKPGKTDQIGGLTSSELYYFAPYGADTLLLQGTDESGDIAQLVQLSVASNPPHTVSEVTLTGSSGGPMAATSGFLGVLNGSSMSLEIYKLSA